MVSFGLMEQKRMQEQHDVEESSLIGRDFRRLYLGDENCGTECLGRLGETMTHQVFNKTRRRR